MPGSFHAVGRFSSPYSIESPCPELQSSTQSRVSSQCVLHAYKCYRAQPRGPDILFPCRCSICIHIVLVRYIQAGRPKNGIVFGPAFVTRLLTPRSQKSGMGFFLGVDHHSMRNYLKNFFLTKFEPKTRENLHSLFWFPIAIDRAWSN